MNMKAILAAAALATVTFGVSAHAATYDFGTIGSEGLETHTSNTINHGAGSFVDTFTFDTVDAVTEFSTGAFTEFAPFSITSADLTLYNSANVALATTGVFDPATEKTPTLSADIGAGDYHILADILVPTGKIGSYTVTATTLVSAAPEPSMWALMIAGVAAVGFAFRQAKKPSFKAALSA